MALRPLGQDAELHQQIAAKAAIASAYRIARNVTGPETNVAYLAATQPVDHKRTKRAGAMRSRSIIIRPR